MKKSESEIIIDGKTVGLSSPTYFIADIAANHDGNIDRAKNLIALAKESGADAVKFQHHDVRKYVSDRGFKELGGKFSHQSKWEKSIFEVYKDAEVPLSWSEELKEYCNELQITFFTTPYDLDMVDKIDPFVPAYKIGSGDVSWNEMLQKIASKRKPVIFASGAANIKEVINAYEILSKDNSNILLMQCNTNYTASEDNFNYINLNVLKTYKALFPNTVLGLSDHTHGHETVLGAVTLGARAIEKHFTDDTTRTGPDHKFSMDARTWSTMVRSTRLLERALGGTTKKVEDNEKETVVLQRRAIRVINKINNGITLERDMIEFQRPCPEDAIKPNDIDYVIGKKIKRDIQAGEYLKIDDFK